MTEKLTVKQKEVQRITDALTGEILRRRLRPGVRLIEAQIVTSLAANRNHVQSAVQRLAQQHIVTIEPHTGAMVAQPSQQEAQDIFVARQAIESAIVTLITPEKLAEGSHASAGQLPEWLTTDHYGDFHLWLAKIAGNQVMEKILHNLLVRSALAMMCWQSAAAGCPPQPDHHTIFAALQAGETERAQQLAGHHVQWMAQSLVPELTPPDGWRASPAERQAADR